MNIQCIPDIFYLSYPLPSSKIDHFSRACLWKFSKIVGALAFSFEFQRHALAIGGF